MKTCNYNRDLNFDDCKRYESYGYHVFNAGFDSFCEYDLEAFITREEFRNIFDERSLQEMEHIYHHCLGKKCLMSRRELIATHGEEVVVNAIAINLCI